MLKKIIKTVGVYISLEKKNIIIQILDDGLFICENIYET